MIFILCVLTFVVDSLESVATVAQILEKMFVFIINLLLSKLIFIFINKTCLVL